MCKQTYTELFLETNTIHKNDTILETRLASARQNLQNGMCAQRRLRSAWASAKIWVFAFRMKKIWFLSYPLSAQRRLIRLGGCPGWSEFAGRTCHLLVFFPAGSIHRIRLWWIGMITSVTSCSLTCTPIITKPCLYNYDPLKPHFYVVKLGFTGVCIIFSYFCSKT